MINILLIFAQIMLLYATWRCSCYRARGVVYRYANPFCFFIIFYALFFLIEQIIFLFTGELIGGDVLAVAQDHGSFTRTQIALAGFVAAIFLGSSISTLMLPAEDPLRARRIFQAKKSRLEQFAAWIFFIIGLLATVYLGVKFSQLIGYRSALVKSTDGKIATAVSFFGNFAFCYLSYSLVERRKYVIAILAAALFGIAILYTGSRGRLMWPLVIAVICFYSSKGKLPVLRIALFGLFGLLLLSIMDPLRKALMSGGSFYISQIGTSILDTFLRRNFDGFSNFNIILNSGLFKPSPGYLFTGIRTIFMDTFFFDVYRKRSCVRVNLSWLFLCGERLGRASSFFGFLRGGIRVY
jgi:hypothetical protein